MSKKLLRVPCSGELLIEILHFGKWKPFVMIPKGKGKDLWRALKWPTQLGFDRDFVYWLIK